MKDNLERLVKNVEEKWLVKLTENCKKQFLNCHLPSHDHVHHLRVWNYAKLLLKHLPVEINVHEENIEQLIIAVFFHDQGMSITPSKEHGKISRQLCKKYLYEQHLQVVHTDLILDVIEKHDDKDYKNIELSSGFNLLAILNIADDLDAFGIIGVYRYLEIYLTRKTEIHKLHEMVADNLRNRYNHFTSLFLHDKKFVQSQTQRYIATRGFFKDLDLQLKQVEYRPDSLLGPMGVVNYINNNLILKNLSLNVAINNALTPDADFYFKHFFEKLKKEC
jgi:HD superfamily phosphodiesterase